MQSLKGTTGGRTPVVPNVYRFYQVGNYGCYIGLSRSGLV